MCLCPEGFHGRSCEIATTVSFDTGDSLSVTQYNDLLDTFNLEFQFRTTLPSGIISAGYISNNMLQYVLYLLNGVIKLTYILALSMLLNSSLKVARMMHYGKQ
ncbi:protein crumbs [Caerostris extrusa]|uniref:Protein crumbs n=1 Tax=Caerostris extrusa TaxID=172846 RepID=A0AAV4XNS7_CAEEX|nr:protein crumbs [Caerostris extrusa]